MKRHDDGEEEAKKEERAQKGGEGQSEGEGVTANEMHTHRPGSLPPLQLDRLQWRGTCSGPR